MFQIQHVFLLYVIENMHDHICISLCTKYTIQYVIIFCNLNQQAPITNISSTITLVCTQLFAVRALHDFHLIGHRTASGIYVVLICSPVFSTNLVGTNEKSIACVTRMYFIVELRFTYRKQALPFVKMLRCQMASQKGSQPSTVGRS